MKLRTPFRRTPAPVEPEPTADLVKVGGKGRPTPKRSAAQSRRRSAEPPPKDRKEAYRRMRDKQRAERVEAREGMVAGDDRFLTARDRGPVRKLVRDLVDSRRNVGQYFLVGALLVVVLSGGNMPAPVRLGANILWVGLMAALVIDSWLISRVIRRTVSERFPNTDERMRSLFFYGILRGTVFRRLRTPKPAVDIGAAV